MADRRGFDTDKVWLRLVVALLAGIVMGTVASFMSQKASASPRAVLPDSAAQVEVLRSAFHSGIDGHMHEGASISGLVRSAATGGSISANVLVFRAGVLAGIGFSDDGAYTVGGLFAGEYDVCVNARSASGGGSPTGYLGRCYQTATYNGGAPPTGATEVALAEGQHKSGINLNLRSAAAVAGNVRAPNGNGLPLVKVYAHNRTNGFTYASRSDATGHFVVAGLTPAAGGYTVCFGPAGVNTGTGYLRRCYHDFPWGGQGYPPSATAVSVRLSQTTKGVNQTLPRGAAISGMVVRAGNGASVAGAHVTVFGTGGKALRTAVTSTTGRYIVKGLAAGTGNRVCVHPLSVTTRLLLHGRCWRAIAWSGGDLPSGTSPVSTRLADVHRGIDFALRGTLLDLGSIAGTVASADNIPMLNAVVSVWRNGEFVGSDATDGAGAYKVGLLRASSGYVVCVDTLHAGLALGNPAMGWAPRCYGGADWDATRPPAGAEVISLGAGETRTGADIEILVAGGISGTVFAEPTGPLASEVKVILYRADGTRIRTTSPLTGNTQYFFPSLVPGTDYVVCFDGRQPGNPHGYAPQCYDDVDWTGAGP